MTILDSKHSKFSSSKTSGKFKAAGFGKIIWEPGTSNFDIGGGKYDLGTNYLRDVHIVENLIYDPYNRSKEFNSNSLKQARFSKTTTIFNVLNVVEHEEDRKEIYRLAVQKYTEYIYITVHEKNANGIAEITRNGYQANKKLEDYLTELESIFDSILISRSLITIRL